MSIASRIIQSVLHRSGAHRAVRDDVIKQMRDDIKQMKAEVGKEVAKKARAIEDTLRQELAERTDKVARRADETEAALRRELVDRTEELSRKASEVFRVVEKPLRSGERNAAELAKQRQVADELSRRIRVVERLIEDFDRPDSKSVAVPSLDRIERHMREQIERHEVLLHPFPHMVVNDLFPDDFFNDLVKRIPPSYCFSGDATKLNWKPQSALGPIRSKALWKFFDAEVSTALIQPLLKKFAAQIAEHHARIFGSAHAEAAGKLPIITSSGRLMLRKPGYHLQPHLDPKGVLLTLLFYLPRPGMQNDTYGTQLFETDSKDFVAGYSNTYYPEKDGIHCKLATTVPFRRNSMLAFLNSGGAHGADIPVEGVPADLERFSYQIYVRPEAKALDELISQLPEERQRPWLLRSDEPGEDMRAAG